MRPRDHKKITKREFLNFFLLDDGYDRLSEFRKNYKSEEIKQRRINLKSKVTRLEHDKKKGKVDEEKDNDGSSTSSLEDEIGD